MSVLEEAMVEEAEANRRKRPKVQADSKQVRKAAAKKEHKKRGERLAEAMGVSYNKHFQSAHARNKLPNPAGHWANWCELLGKDGIMKCIACREVRQLVVEAQKDQAEAPPLEAPAQAVVPASSEAVAPGRGRPKAGAQVATLATWVAQNRPGIYVPLSGGQRWHCQLCQKEVNCFRSSYSGKRRLLQHEANNPSMHLPAEQSTPCPGVLLGAGTGLDHIQQSVKEYFAGGCLQCKGELANCTFAFMNDTVVLKRTGCAARGKDGEACVQCVKLGNSKEVHEHVCLWAWRQQMATYGRKLALSTAEECQQMREELWDRDFAGMKMARPAINKRLQGLWDVFFFSFFILWFR